MYCLIYQLLIILLVLIPRYACFPYFTVVHEKTILFSLLPLLMVSNHFPALSQWFTLLCSYSMIPLFIKDQNLIVAIALSVCFFLVMSPNPHENKWINRGSGGCLVVMVLSILYYAVNPPRRYPDLHSVIISSFSCALFFLYFCIMSYYHYQMKRVKIE